MKSVIIRSMGLYLNTLALVSPRTAAENGFRIFCRPLRGTINEKQHAFFNSAERSIIEHDDEKIQVYKWGTGDKKVVFFHGWQSHTYRWKNYIDALPKDEYTIYALDAPGHGLSSGKFLSVPVYGSLIQQFLIGLGEVDTIIGHSLGGFSMLYTFYSYPLLSAKKMILLAPPGEATDFLSFYKDTLKLTNRSMELIHDHFESVYQVRPDYFSAAKFASSIKIPGLIIHDKRDEEAPFKYARMIHEQWKKSSLLATDGFGHNLRSTEVVQAVVTFITANAHQHLQRVSL
ncbi:MAG TPA: alpha/beta hydrolase [Chryseosolibacter sp.]|nr:alpha/beta hydrolase [Chryseosolibacter sp.]